MNTRKPAAAVTLRKDATGVNVDVETSGPVKVLKSDLKELEGLAIIEDTDEGGDPYNNTGSHYALAAKEAAKKRDK